MPKQIGLIDFVIEEYPKQIEALNFDLLVSMITKDKQNLYHIRLLGCFVENSLYAKYRIQGVNKVWYKKKSILSMLLHRQLWNFEARENMWKSMDFQRSYAYGIDNIVYHFETNQLEFIGWYALPVDLQCKDILTLDRMDVKEVYPDLYSTGFSKRIEVDDKTECCLSVDEALEIRICRDLITCFRAGLNSIDDLTEKYGKIGSQYKKSELKTLSEEYVIDRYHYADQEQSYQLTEPVEGMFGIARWCDGILHIDSEITSRYVLLVPAGAKVCKCKIQQHCFDDSDVIVCNYSIWNGDVFISRVERDENSFYSETPEYMSAFVIVKSTYIKDGLTVTEFCNMIVKEPAIKVSVRESENLIWDIKDKEFKNKLVAFYLPQYHTIKENDEWWGKGFTEWTNVKKAKPQFEGHRQPRIPGELGYYSLDDIEVQKRQAALAESMGIYGFCYYYYWFAGKRLLEKPLNRILEHPEIDLPFCICWANESWTRRWDGKEADILIEQKHNEETDTQFIYEVIPIMKDPRYIRYDNKPLLLIYRIELFPRPNETIARWREICRKEGIPDIYVAVVQSFDCIDNRIYGADAAIEFPPHKIPTRMINERMRDRLYSNFEGSIYSYKELVEHLELIKKRQYEYIPGIMKEWDNTARKGNRAHIFTEYSEELYNKWLLRNRVYADMYSDEKFVFINAWNEWAEGTYLEPEGEL